MLLLTAVLAGSGGNPVETLDLGLALQARSLDRLASNRVGLVNGPQPVPADINQDVAQRMLATML